MAHILIVDDSPTEVMFTKKILERQGHRISDAGNGEEGIQKAQKLQPDLIIMDVVMPGLDGFQATRKISKNPDTQSIPIIVVSSKAMAIDREWGLKMGAAEYITKPFKANDLIETVNKLLLRSLS